MSAHKIIEGRWIVAHDATYTAEGIAEDIEDYVRTVYGEKTFVNAGVEVVEEVE